MSFVYEGFDQRPRQSPRFGQLKKKMQRTAQPLTERDKINNSSNNNNNKPNQTKTKTKTKTHQLGSNVGLPRRGLCVSANDGIVIIIILIIKMFFHGLSSLL
jgi:hypothetical protein